MGLSHFFQDPSWIPPLTRFVALYVGVWLYKKNQGRGNATSFSLTLFAASVGIVTLGRVWLSFVTENAPEPYLDEVFHIPQAQVFCQGRYDWDDKITTPPGLYGLTLLMNWASQFPCSVFYLRMSNVEMTAYLCAAAVVCKHRIEQGVIESGSGSGSTSSLTWYAAATGVNIALFPVIFFFSGLYYTDIASTLVVLLAYMNHLKRTASKSVSWTNELATFVIGICALFMRQTNIFWVVVYMAGLEIVHALRCIQPTPVEAPSFKTSLEQVRFYLWRYSLGEIHDIPLNSASPTDAVLCAVSVLVAAVCNLSMIIKRCVWPHRFVLVAFVGFIAWNGGVVLGDKSNHVATIHLAQMLYIWPLFAFFSAPLFIPQILAGAASLVSPRPTPVASSSPRSGLLKALETPATLLVATLLASFVAGLNTIVHPFTLADNRHYMFYVFRYTIRRTWWARFALVPAYVVCGWFCLGALRGVSPFTTSYSSLVASQDLSEGATNNTLADENGKRQGGKKSARTKPVPKMDAPTPASSATSVSPPTSTVLLLLLATALSLVTAPLVEPRYFILPWVFWRLLVPSLQISSSPSSSPPSQALAQRKEDQKQHHGNLVIAATFPVLLETLWFLLINTVTMYIFITRPFYWYHQGDDGSATVVADGGRVQRFMW